MKKLPFVLCAILAACLVSCGETTQRSQSSQSTENSDTLVEFQEFTLDNGLKVVFHIDRSDPVVAVALTAHVGSSREKPGRTGFAHLFEHLLFLESENLGKGGLDAMSARIGGSGANGSTSRDRTNYFQTVPKDALEKMIWAEADKIGFFINTVTEPVLAKEKQVVKNEKRQSYDNQPYGHNFYVITKALYPDDHPYSWEVIGSLEDLDAATLDDVKQFYRDWYTPNNVTLVIAGDFDPEQARGWIKKYFDEIPRGPDVEPLPKQSVALGESKLLFHEDNFAQLPQLTMVWPTVPQFHADYYALNVLHDLLAVGKRAPLNEVLIDEEKVAPGVSMYGYNSELSGETILQIRAYDGTNLNDVKGALDQGFARFEADGIDEKDLNRVKTEQEVSFYNGIQSVLGKAFNLAQYEIFTGDPGFINQDIENIQAVTADDVMRVYRAYIKDRPFIATSFVPKGSSELILDGSIRAEVVEEEIVQGAEETFDASIAAEYERTPSSFDRSEEPPYGEKPVVKVPDIREAGLDNGLSVYGIEDSELPLVRFELSFDGGHYLDDPTMPGVAYMLSIMMDKGTAQRDTAELEEAIAALGASIGIGAGDERFQISGQTLARNFEQTLSLVEEILLEPRWDEEEFALAKQRVTAELQAASANPNAIASNKFGEIMFGEGHILATSVRGDMDSLATMTIDDLKAYYERYISPSAANFRIVGAVSQERALEALASLNSRWSGAEIDYPEYSVPNEPDASVVYFYDMPGATQSVFTFGYPALKRTDDDYYPALVMNYRLGGGGFASRLTQELRESKGYTYGIGSGFSGSERYGAFSISSNIRSNVTFEAAALVKDILENYGATFTEEDLDVTKSFLLKSKARAFETLGAKLGVLQNIADYDLPYDYVRRQDEIVEAMTVERIQELADSYITPDAMNYIIVGDAATQAESLTELGFGAPVMLETDE
ncbi:pitrilysin family protein [Hyphococcus flavus]|uniref:Pitrilysin family protein n=1 Tax=Hyphococcus flavus TaxID=1866326 RepID=A0AAF0CGH4_9PROT|nr:pitrilysin family protein [Hyphococcus flavus]WDI32369.1 pitrilysin family protein [Hyphococcus flavus]